MGGIKIFSVYLAVGGTLRNELEQAVNQSEQAVLAAASSDLRTALEECQQERPGVLVLDDALLADHPGLVETLANVSYPIVLMADPDAPAVARRALAVRARDVLGKEGWQAEFMACLERVAVPIAGEHPDAAKILSVFSAKGGVGKTTLSVNLAVAIAERTHDPVILVDLDLSFGDVASTVGKVPQITIHDLLDVHLDAAVLQRAVTKVTPNLAILPAPLLVEQAEDVTVDKLVTIFTLLRTAYAYIVVDMAPGYDDLNVTILDISDAIMTVCTPDVVTLRKIGQALQLFQKGLRYPESKIRLVMNQSRAETGVESSDVETILHYPLAFELPYDSAASVKAANDGIPLITKFPESALAKAIRAMANTIVREPLAAQRKDRRRSSKKFGNLFSLFRR